MGQDEEAAIRLRAHAIWERDGQPQGMDAEHWRQAELEIMAERAAATVHQAGGLEEEPRIWNVAAASAAGETVTGEVPEGDPAGLAGKLGDAKGNHP